MVDSNPTLYFLAYYGGRVDAFPHLPSNLNYLSLSPDGVSLLVSYYGAPPIAWRDNPYEKWARSIGFSNTQITILTNLITGQTIIPIATPYLESIPEWNSTGTAFAAIATKPQSDGATTELQQDDHPDALAKRVFWVTPSRHLVQQVTMHSEMESMQPLKILGISQNDEIFVQTAHTTVVRYWKAGTHWEVQSELKLPPQAFARYGRIATNGNFVVGENEKYPNASYAIYLSRWGCECTPPYNTESAI